MLLFASRFVLGFGSGMSWNRARGRGVGGGGPGGRHHGRIHRQGPCGGLRGCLRPRARWGNGGDGGGVDEGVFEGANDLLAVGYCVGDVAGIAVRLRLGRSGERGGGGK